MIPFYPFLSTPAPIVQIGNPNTGYQSYVVICQEVRVAQAAQFRPYKLCLDCCHSWPSAGQWPTRNFYSKVKSPSHVLEVSHFGSFQAGTVKLPRVAWEIPGDLGVLPGKVGFGEGRKVSTGTGCHRVHLLKLPLPPGELISVAWRSFAIPRELQTPPGGWQPSQEAKPRSVLSSSSYVWLTVQS